MTNPMQISPFARLTVNPHTYRDAIIRDGGVSFARTDRSSSRIFFTFEKIRELLAKPENTLEPDFFIVERQALRKTGVVAAVGMLPD